MEAERSVEDRQSPLEFVLRDGDGSDNLVFDVREPEPARKLWMDRGSVEDEPQQTETSAVDYVATVKLDMDFDDWNDVDDDARLQSALAEAFSMDVTKVLIVSVAAGSVLARFVVSVGERTLVESEAAKQNFESTNGLRVRTQALFLNP